MIAEYRTNFEDFKAAQRLALRNSRLRLRLRLLYFQRIVPMAGVVAAGLLIWLIYSRKAAADSELVAALAFVSLLGLYLPWKRARHIKRLYLKMKNGRSDDDPLLLELTDKELILRVPGRGESRLLPNVFTKLAENHQVTMLYYSPFNFILLPKRTVAAWQLEELKEWLRARTELNF